MTNFSGLEEIVKIYLELILLTSPPPLMVVVVVVMVVVVVKVSFVGRC